MSARRRRASSTPDHPAPSPAAPDHPVAGTDGGSSPPINYRRLFECAPDAILIVDSQGRYLDANRAACELTGYSLEEIRQMRVGDLVPPTDRPMSANRFKKLRTEGLTRGDRLIRRKNGTIVPIEAHAISLQDGNFQTTIRDVSKATEAQTELQRSLDAYSTLLDLCHATVISTGPDGRIRSWNPAAEELLGYSAKEMIGRSVAILVPKRLREKHESMFARRAVATGNERFARTFYSDALRKNGTEVPVEISVGVGQHGDERIFTAVIRDITQHRDMVETLNDALQRLRFHIDRMPLAYIVWDVDFRVVEWNPAAERIFGYTKSEAVHQHCYDLIVPPDIVTTVDEIWAGLLKGDTSSHSINPNVRKDGTRFVCEWFNTSLRDSAGLIRGVASMALDVSEREAIAARIRDAQKLESLGVLAGGVAHDFNSSLMVILGNTALLRAIKGLPPRAIEHIELIEAAGSRASELVKHLLTYARTGRHNPQPTDINAIIRDALKLIRSTIGKDHELELQLAESAATMVADQSQVEQVLLNLCLNAKEAMLEGGTIILQTDVVHLDRTQLRRCIPFNAKPGRYVEIVVKDTGKGMDKNTLVRIFDPFFTTKAEGHGLGMAAVLGILRQHDAVVRVDTQVNKGTTVRVMFPASTNDKTLVPVANARRRSKPVRKPKRKRKSN